MLTLKERNECERKIAQVYEQEIAQLKKKVRLLTANNSKWKQKYYAIKGPKSNIRNNRTSKAEVFVKSWIAGDKSLTFNQIAELCFISIETVKNISYKLRHKSPLV